jgi:hypothetical protein
MTVFIIIIRLSSMWVSIDTFRYKMEETSLERVSEGLKIITLSRDSSWIGQWSVVEKLSIFSSLKINCIITIFILALLKLLQSCCRTFCCLLCLPLLHTLVQSHTTFKVRCGRDIFDSKMPHKIALYPSLTKGSWCERWVYEVWGAEEGLIFLWYASCCVSIRQCYIRVQSTQQRFEIQ